MTALRFLLWFSLFFALAYIVGAFSVADFNIAHWSKYARGTVASAGVAIGFIAGLIAINTED
jgi:hypothetical protein